MSIVIEPVTVDDAARKTEIQLEAFKSHPRMPMMWPGGFGADWFAYQIDHDLQNLNDPDARVFKAIETSSGDMVGYAEWSMALNPVINASQAPTQPDALPPDNWPAGGNWQMRLFFKINIERLLKQHLHVLNFLAVTPSAQGRGVGAKLLAWGIEEADRQGVALVLESTPAGFPLYRKADFEQVEIINANMHDFGWKEPYDEAAAVRILMIRRPRTS